MNPRSNRKTALGQRSTKKTTFSRLAQKPEPAIWSRDTGQRIPCFDRCQLTMIWMSKIKVKTNCGHKHNKTTHVVKRLNAVSVSENIFKTKTTMEPLDARFELLIV